MNRIPERLNMADWFLEARLREGAGGRVALRTDGGEITYEQVHEMACRFAGLYGALDVRPEERVIVALPDSPSWVGAFFGALRLGAVVVMVNPYLKAEQLAYFLGYTRARCAVVHTSLRGPFLEAAALAAGAGGQGGVIPVQTAAAPQLRHIVVDGDPGLHERFAAASSDAPCFPSHRDDPAIWLFSGGTTGKPKAVIQSHGSFVNTTLRYAHGVLGMRPDDVTISVPKLFFGYATGSNLLFPFSVGASAVLFADKCSAELLVSKIARHRATILINVPTLIQQMVALPDPQAHDLKSLRLATSAGEALPAQLHERWNRLFGVQLLDGLGTAEQWHIFISNRPGEVKPGTLGKVVPGFRVKLCDDQGVEVPRGEIGELWVAGESRALGYWQRMTQTMRAFRGEWYVSGDMLRLDEDECYVYCGRSDDMLKVSGKWLSPAEVEGTLLHHPAVAEVAVVGMEVDGLTVPEAFVVLAANERPSEALAQALRAHVTSALESYKCPRRLHFLDELPRTHLGKVDRGRLRSAGGSG